MPEDSDSPERKEAKIPIPDDQCMEESPGVVFCFKCRKPVYTPDERWISPDKKCFHARCAPEH